MKKGKFYSKKLCKYINYSFDGHWLVWNYNFCCERAWEYPDQTELTAKNIYEEINWLEKYAM